MKTRYKLLLCFFILVTFYSCTKEDEIPSDVEVNDFIWKAMNGYYLHQGQIPDLSDRRFNSQPALNNYLRNFESPDELFTSLLFNNPTTNDTSTLIEDYNLLTAPEVRVSNTHGVEYGIIAEPGSIDNVIGYVQYILPNSDASTKTIARGEFFYGVNNTQLTRDNYTALLNGTNFLLNMADFDGTSLTPNAKTVSLTSTSYTHLPVFLSKNIASGSNNIGYLMYHNDFSNNYISDLNTAFLQFKNQGVNQLVLDARYNIGGGSFVENINQIASMITGQFTDQPFVREKWNSKAQPWFEMHQPDSLITNFTDKLSDATPINHLQLTDVYIILNGSSSSIELLINSLKSYVNVHLINSTDTDGDNTGSITLYNSIDYNVFGASPNHSFAVQPIVLEFLNNDDVTYADGFSPDMRICSQEDILNLGELGETTDPILSKVLNFVNNGTIAPPNCNPNNFEFVFNSVLNQRLLDTGVFIKQDLPNTN